MNPEPSQPTRQAIAAQNRSLPGRVTGRLLTAVNAMVWQAASRKEAAVIAGMTDHSLRQALRRRHVMDHYLRECEVLRLSGRAKRLHRLEEIAAMDRNLNASVAAIKAAELIVDDPVNSSAHRQQVPGLVVVIQGTAPSHPAPPAPTVIEPTEPRKQLWLEAETSRLMSRFSSPRSPMIECGKVGSNIAFGGTLKRIPATSTIYANQ